MSTKSRYLKRKFSGFQEVKVRDNQHDEKKQHANKKKDQIQNKQLRLEKSVDEILSLPLESKLLAFSARDIPKDPNTWTVESNEESPQAKEPTNSTYDKAEYISDKKTKRKLTPLEKQIIDLKMKHPSTLLMVACGYRYRFFGDKDANVASKVLDIR